MSHIPRETRGDHTAALFIDGYEFVTKRCRKYRSDVFATRLLLQTAICGQGHEAARIFYDSSRVTRKGGLPRTALELLLDFGSVAMLDDAAHRHRKAMFMSLMTPDRVADLAERATMEWEDAIGGWRGAERVVLLHAARGILFRAVCTWAGIPLGVGEGGQRVQEMATMVDGAGSVGIRQLRGRLARRSAEEWARRVIRSIRSGDLDVPGGRAAHWSGSPFDFVPQGGGDHYSGHRCAGEWITIELVKVAVRPLVARMDYDVPAQGLRVSLSRMPSMPASGFAIRNVTPTG